MSLLIATVTNEHNHTFNVFIKRNSRNNKLNVAIFDITRTPDGQNVQTYNADTVRNIEAGYGLDMYASVAAWTLTADNVKQIQEALEISKNII